MSKIKKKVDELNNIHFIELNNELGRGGQGVVYNTKNADTVIKIALKDNSPIKNKKEIKAFHSKIKELIFKPLPYDIRIAKPLTVLENEAGYVMELLNGMESFAKLLPQEIKKDEVCYIKMPDFLKEYSKTNKREAYYIAHYSQSGGLRKRLYTLSRLAIILNRLHSRGLVYFDISHNNVFVNKDDIPLVYLIDADNIEYESKNIQTIYTPNFEVPELMKNVPNSTYSDIYAFGILSFLTLTTVNPFDGEGLEEEDWDSDSTITKKKWELPWIEDSNDDSNKSKSGLRGNLVVTEELNLLFHKLFEEGKNDKYKRPTLPIWIEALEKAACQTLKCANCSMSYYNNIFNQCPFCDSIKPKRLIIKSYYLREGEKEELRWEHVIEVTEKPIELPNYIFKSFDMLQIDDIFLEIKFSKKNRVDLTFFDRDNEICFASKSPITNYNKRVGIQKFEEGFTIVTRGAITTLVEIKMEL